MDPRKSVNDIRARRDMFAVAHELEQHWGLPIGSLLQVGVSWIGSDANKLTWTTEGALAACRDAELGAQLAAAVTRSTGDGLELLATLRQLVGISEASDPRRDSVDVELYAGIVSGVAVKSPHAVSMLAPDAPGLTDLPVPPKAEHAFAVTDGGTVVALACNRPSLSVDNHRLHAVGVWTHPDYRRRGMAKAAVSVLVDHLALDGDAALWVCDVCNTASLRLAHSVGFVELWRIFSWGG